MRMASKALSLINVEYKNHSVNITSQAIDNVPNFALMNGIATGTNDSDRVGKSLKITSAMIRAVVTLDPTTPTNTFCRFMVVLDKQSNSTTPTMTDILDTISVHSFRNTEKGKRFTVLTDRRFSITTEKPQYVFNSYHKLNTHVEYDGTGSTEASISTNSLWFIFFSELASNAPVMNYQTRVRYIDN
jgi:hypothetical protein